jgi:hypothetical protein
MDQKQIEALKRVLTEWNPLGNYASTITDLDNYDTEATDIIFHASPEDSPDRIIKLTIQVLEEAFEFRIETSRIGEFRERIVAIIKKN